MKDRDEYHTRKYPNRKRVLIHRVRSRRRPVVYTAHGGAMHRPYDWSVFGFDECQDEYARRKEIYKLMTADEREVFDKYCGLRDDG